MVICHCIQHHSWPIWGYFASVFLTAFLAESSLVHFVNAAWWPGIKVYAGYGDGDPEPPRSRITSCRSSSETDRMSFEIAVY
ncbi:hypothetical protein BDV19DRAFT_366686 [Aspergillus venezuelensis]